MRHLPVNLPSTNFRRVPLALRTSQVTRPTAYIPGWTQYNFAQDHDRGIAGEFLRLLRLRRTPGASDMDSQLRKRPRILWRIQTECGNASARGSHAQRERISYSDWGLGRAEWSRRRLRWGD